MFIVFEKKNVNLKEIVLYSRQLFNVGNSLLCLVHACPNVPTYTQDKHLLNIRTLMSRSFGWISVDNH